MLGAWSVGHGLAVAADLRRRDGRPLDRPRGHHTLVRELHQLVGGAPHIDLVEERCNGSADCVLVCPRDVLEMNGPRRKVEIANPDRASSAARASCSAPTDALRFRYDDGRVVEASTIRRTRLNMLGRRTVQVTD